MRTPRFAVVLAALPIVISACADQQPFMPDAAFTRMATASTQARVIQGTTGPGALYEIHVPAAWNGELIVYAHGIRDASEPISLRDQDNFHTLRDELVGRGYAFAYSSYSQNGLAFKDAAQRTHQLRSLFISHVANPKHVYLAGHSLGAVATLMLAERYPAQYSGVLPMCGQVGGIQGAVDYFGHVRVLFDYFYPGVLPGNAVTVADVTDLNAQIIFPALMAMQANPMGAGAIARIMHGLGTPVPASDGAELVQSILIALGYGVRVLPDLYDRTHGHSPFDNMTTEYGSAAYLGEALHGHLNATIDRFSATPDARNYLRLYYEPTGNLNVPALTLFTPLDPVSAPFHEPTYRATVAAAGQSHRLVQRSGAALYGHCSFTVPEMLQAFEDLVGWVSTGNRPAS
jgi:pimeloyl-ACP methyl ester carboxylesterase